MNFEERFQQLTGKNPYPWQSALYHSLLTRNVPHRMSLPTGAGKTSIIPIWLKRSLVSTGKRITIDRSTPTVFRGRPSGGGRPVRACRPTGQKKRGGYAALGTALRKNSVGKPTHCVHLAWPACPRIRRHRLRPVRLSTTLNNRSVDYDRSFAPFGEVYKNFGSTANNNFTGDTQDTIAGTYDTPHRELNPSQGRWLSPDPAGLQAVNPSNPQSWNRYAYVLNNPLSNIDPSGLACLWDDGSFDSADDPETGSARRCSGQGGTWVNPELFENAMLTNGQWNSTYGD